MAEKQLVEHDSAARVAYELMNNIRADEGKGFERGYILELYAQCYKATTGLNPLK